ncbi:type I restriction-modification system endonuclease [Streptococcus azizii]|uniref:Type I restriction-modification system endonuclease n=1 Tax=Streptococcus azizii TaxID=1579424 RepID=A0AB36JKI1_9STRE|nr:MULTISPECIES: type I restriction-modification system endonuclease [Streptococcus]MBF0776819.1 type I restriction-modification system endonuclease [Streptococcus sp. 19428wD3_AN2]ONK25693.1 type I restriction-modification system endonuclease [Streptococcus azizii]ONK25995.1 type I restriction-modification system endonuclease [Streptococcus azizii]ONK26141.1 type I restriction-modification system endonuclease [Streptococcus azizii]TFU82330.1 type I restriction-modification system endonuclease
MSNFSFLKPEWPQLANPATRAEIYVYSDSNSAMIQLRQFAERMTEALFRLENITPWNVPTQLDKLKELQRVGVLEDDVAEAFHIIRKYGNKAAHDSFSDSGAALKLLGYAHFLATWFMEAYGPIEFVAQKFEKPVSQEEENAQLHKEVEELRKQLEISQSEKQSMQKALEMTQAERQALEEAVVRYRNEPEATKIHKKERSKAYLRNVDFNEYNTRIMFIDEQLHKAGWEVDTANLDWRKGTRPQKNKNLAIAEVPTPRGRADYGLFIGLDLVGIVEAKRYNKAISGDLIQSKGYARKIDVSSNYNLVQSGKYKIPFLYASNGRPYLKQLEDQSGIWFWDSRTETVPSYALEAWHSPEDLKRKLEVDIIKAETELVEEEYPDFAGRYYQIEAIKSVEKAISENKRRMLLALATGTGKTRLSLALMYRLLKTKRMRRILFLVDRRSLGEQASDVLIDTQIENQSFASIYDIKGVDEIFAEKNTRVHIATVQGMVRRLFYTDDESEIPSVGTYDFIIVDEAHRGYTEDRELSEEELLYQNEQEYVSQYRRVIDYFDASVLALTATPALHTTRIFGDPIYTYSYRDAVVDGYLVDHEPPYQFETELSRNGITFEANSDIDVWDARNKSITKAHLDDDLKFDVAQFNKKVINENFNRAILSELVNYIDPNEGGKSLIFAVTDYHADQIVRILKEEYRKADIPVPDDAIEKITGYIAHPDKEIKRFKNEKYPNIVVTVDLLTTGIDVPEIENLVFMRRVRSRILYDQMLGRATRLCPEINKESFKIFDAVKLYDTLKDITDMKPIVSNPSQTIDQILEKALSADDNFEFEFFKNELIAKLQRRKQRLSKEAINELAELNNVRSIDMWLQELKAMNKQELAGQQEKINRVAHYRNYVDIAISHDSDMIKEVTRGYGVGNVKPGDYLNDFNRFIRENINLIPALEVVVKRPKELTYKELREVQLRLKENHFDERNLQEAWRHEKKERVAADIISFIRQAALGTGLVDHETRIKNAMKKVYGMEDWTPMQLKWLKRIEKQLLETPVLAPTAKQYFDETEVWKQNGGYKQIQRHVGKKIDLVIQVLNDQLYA